ncbi:hypothetical protein NP493_353g01008 [Ridgeia piscesae]|uniref:Uncharacterized protein n=1 Tax=Ridgeia piscesae TaxID=27915 RepID=A0AAD9NVH2_RIDPI|nr:hypothetical protein NP493_353g01008 [Ridgeia piscesae]
MSTTLRSRTLKATSTWDRDTAPETKSKTRRFNIQRRITAGWTAFAKHSDMFKGNIGTCLKIKAYNSCILPAMTYGAETRALTTHAWLSDGPLQFKILATPLFPLVIHQTLQYHCYHANLNIKVD